MIKKIIVAFLILSLILPETGVKADQQSQPQTQSTSCSTFQTDNNYFFDNYEQHEYINGFLALHLKLKTPWNDGRVWGSTFVLFNDQCVPESVNLYMAGFAIRPKLQYFSIRFTSPTHFVFWDDEQDVQFNCAKCEADIPATLSNGLAYSTISYQPFTGDGDWLHSTALSITGTNPPPAHNPLVIIPGILGSELYDGDTKVWLDLNKMILNPSILDALDLDQLGRGKVLGPRNVLDKVDYVFGTMHYTDLLVSDLENRGYKLNSDLFLFAYDWRMSTVDLAAQFSDYLKNIRSQTGTKTIDIVAHSLGGLIAKQYLFSAGDQDIGKLVFVGVPHLGSAEAARDLIFGTDFGVVLVDIGEMQKISQNMPSVYDLLPSKEYFNRIPGFYDDFVNSAVKGILNYDQSQVLLRQLGKNSQMIAAGSNLHANLDNIDYSKFNFPVYNIVGCGVYTIKTINKMYSEPNIFQKIIYGPKYRIYADSGDGTVLIGSASGIKVKSENNFYVPGTEHSKLLSSDSGRNLIENLLAGKAGLPPGVSNDFSGCALQGKLISLRSGLDIKVTDINNNPIDVSSLKPKVIANDEHLFLPTDSGQIYHVTIKNPLPDNKPVDLSVTNITPVATTVNNYNQINLGSGALDLAVDPNSAGVKSDNQGTSTDLQPDQTINQDQLDQSQDNNAVQQGQSANPAPPAPAQPAPDLSQASAPTPAPIYIMPAPAPQPIILGPQQQPDSSNHQISDSGAPSSQDQPDLNFQDSDQSPDSTSSQGNGDIGQSPNVIVNVPPVQSAAPQIIYLNPNQQNSQAQQQTSGQPQSVTNIFNSGDSFWQIPFNSLSWLVHLIFF